MFTLGSRLNSLRINSHLSLDELAAVLSTAKSTLCRIENDKVSPSSELLLSISQFFNVSTDWLLTGETPRSINNFFNTTEFNPQTNISFSSFLKHMYDIPDDLIDEIECYIAFRIAYYNKKHKKDHDS